MSADAVRLRELGDVEGLAEVVRKRLSWASLHWFPARTRGGIKTPEVAPEIAPEIAMAVLASDWLANHVRVAVETERERIAQAIERQKAIAEETRDIIETPLPKNNFDQQAWAYGDAARLARADQIGGAS